MLDVANAAGVSRTTASYVLNGLNVAIPQETRDHVLSVAHKMGYRTNRMAQQLAKQRSGFIGVIIPVIASPYFAYLATHINAFCRTAGFQMLLEAAHSYEEDPCWQHALDQLLSWGVDGLLLLWDPAIDLQQIRYAALEVPVVVVGIEPIPEEDLDWLYVDLYAGARAGMAHLMDQGHREIGYVGHPSVGDPRYRAVVDMLAAAGLNPPMILVGPREEFYARVRALTGAYHEPTAFFCVNDTEAMVVQRALWDAGRRVPHDVSLVSGDSHWEADYTIPALTGVAIPSRQAAECSFQLLLQRINGDTRAKQHLVIPPTFVVRESVAPRSPG
jgi:DNA-binding LacI/PurR family transcriptional regulator